MASPSPSPSPEPPSPSPSPSHQLASPSPSHRKTGLESDSSPSPSTTTLVFSDVTTGKSETHGFPNDYNKSIDYRPTYSLNAFSNGMVELSIDFTIEHDD